MSASSMSIYKPNIEIKIPPKFKKSVLVIFIRVCFLPLNTRGHHSEKAWEQGVERGKKRIPLLMTETDFLVCTLIYQDTLPW